MGDRQTEFERLFMDDNFLYGEDWYIDDVILEAVALTEYQMYQLDCAEAGEENE